MSKTSRQRRKQMERDAIPMGEWNGSAMGVYVGEMMEWKYRPRIRLNRQLLPIGIRRRVRFARVAKVFGGEFHVWGVFDETMAAIERVI